MFVGLEDVDEVVGYASHLAFRWLCRRDVHPAIEQARIAVDHFTAPRKCDLDTYRGLAGSGCTDDGDQPGR